ncbi:molybdopterin-guanine dinucleotide biosynthesis protein B [Exilibacterium tricleocarpae]|nr:molybdopterin-guanine dinucleotide biosynthesis protein MobB [Exilibacterium tricleocarpae]
MKAFGLVGWSGSGCTDLLIRLIRYYRLRNLLVSTVKLASVRDDEGVISMESRRLRGAGCEQAVFLRPGEWHSADEDFSHTDALAALLRKMTPVDLVLIEGLKEITQPKLLLVHPKLHHQLENTQLLATACPNVVGLVAEEPTAGLNALDLPVLKAADTGKIAAFICRTCLVPVKAEVFALPGQHAR